ncbi:hypothetical protein HMSSN139_31230 [Paenibacillus sp. HMSSN-139]|nr:hypothetical protein HMSSN139_31230 [Paenibacillus sp. HMSSN-139]
MDKTTKSHYMSRIDEKLTELPWYVAEYIDTRKRKLSHTTLLNYCHDYIIFLIGSWPNGLQLPTAKTSNCRSSRN